MKEQAKESNHLYQRYALLCFVLIVVCIILRMTVPFFPWVYEIGVLAGLGGFIYLYIRYFVTFFSYEIDGTWFRVYKQTGRRITLEAEFPIRNIMSITRRGEPAYQKEGLEPKSFNYCPSIRPKNPCYLYVLMDKDYADLIAIECSEEFFRLLCVKQKNQCKGEPKETHPKE